MDRLILQPGAIPLDTDGGSIQRNAMIALGYLARAAIGTGTVVDGLACSPTAPASMTVNIGPGSVISLETIDATAFGSLPVDGNPLVKIGVNAEGVTPFALAAPTTSGQSINYLIEATFQESDGTAVVLPYYNPDNPAEPFSGPANSGAAQNTVRAQKVELQLKAGAAATTGTQATPAVDSGWVGLYVITVNFGQSTVTAGSIAQYPTAPFVGGKLGNALQASSSLADASGLLASSGWVQALLAAAIAAYPHPGFSNIAVFTLVSGVQYVAINGQTAVAATSWTIPAGVTKVRARIIGGGGGGGGYATSVAGGGGGAGGYAEGIFTVVPGNTYTITIGAGGSGGTSGAAGGAGGTTSFASFATCTGGSGGGATGAAPGGAGGTATGGALNVPGGFGNDGNPAGAGTVFGVGNGAAGPFGGAGMAGIFFNAGENGHGPGSGGAGSYTAGTPTGGGAGAAGVITLEF